MRTVKTKYESLKCLETMEVIAACDFFEDAAKAEEVLALVIPDGGTCVMGNQIYCWVVPPKCRKPVQRKLFKNPWSQGEQQAALKKMIELSVKWWPELNGAITTTMGLWTKRETC